MYCNFNTLGLNFNRLDNSVRAGDNSVVTYVMVLSVDLRRNERFE